MVEHVVLPHIAIFGWGVLVVETALAVLLLIGLSVAQTPGEWPWSYWMMIGIHVVLLFGVAGERLAVDAVRARRAGALRTITTTWGTVAFLAGIVAVIGSMGEPTSARGTSLGGPAFSISLGSFNLIGAVAVLICAAGLVGAASGHARLGLVTFAVGVLAALVLYVEPGHADPLLGGTNTSAAFFLTLAVIGLVAQMFGSRRSRVVPAVGQVRGATR